MITRNPSEKTTWSTSGMQIYTELSSTLAVITVHNLVPSVFWLFGQLKPGDSGYEIALSTSLNSVFWLATKAEAVLVFPFSVALALRKANFASRLRGAVINRKTPEKTTWSTSGMQIYTELSSLFTISYPASSGFLVSWSQETLGTRLHCPRHWTLFSDWQPKQKPF